jgi:hypothetical protein
MSKIVCTFVELKKYNRKKRRMVDVERRVARVHTKDK